MRFTNKHTPVNVTETWTFLFFKFNDAFNLHWSTGFVIYINASMHIIQTNTSLQYQVPKAPQMIL